MRERRRTHARGRGLFGQAFGLAVCAAMCGLCGCGNGSGASGASAASGAPATGDPKKSGNSAAPPSGGAPVEQPLSHYEMIPIETAKAAQAALAKVVAAPSDFGNYLAFRRAMACGEPFFRDRGKVAEELYGPKESDSGGALGDLDREISAGEPTYSGTAAAKVKSALAQISASYQKERARQARVPFLLPRTVYSLGEVLAGARPGQPRRPSARIADALGLVDVIEGLTMHNQAFASVDKDMTAVSNQVQAAIASLRKALKAAEKDGEIKGRAALIVTTGTLGANVRRALGPSSDLWVPYPPAVSARDKSLPKMGGIDEPTSVLTAPRDDRLSALNTAQKALFGAAGSPMDRFVRGDEKALSEEELSGFDVLVNKGCTRCHAPPLYGVLQPPELTPLDAPTLRALAGKGPYFKDRSRPTLESVVDTLNALGEHEAVKDKGGQKFELSAAERKALIRFLQMSLAEPKKH
ncbi:MAG: hypothetical protein U0441_20645 [Polyangiaceae bacterium]